MNYIILTVRQRKTKTVLFDKLYDQFSQLKIKRFYLKIKSIFVRQEIGKENIINLFKCIMSATIKQIVQEFVRVDKATAISNKKMMEVIGQSKYYIRNEDSTHVAILNSKFMNLFFGFV